MAIILGPLLLTHTLTRISLIDVIKSPSTLACAPQPSRGVLHLSPDMAHTHGHGDDLIKADDAKLEREE